MSNNRTILGKNLLVRTIATANNSNIMTVSSSNFIRGEIIQVGNGYSGDKDRYNMSDFNINDIVVFNEKAAQPIIFDNQRYLIIDVLNIIAIEKGDK
jgi:co-chaperonin GroES (HSP10)